MIVIKNKFSILISILIVLNITGCSVSRNIHASERKEDSLSKEVVEEEKSTHIPDTKEIIYTLCSDDFGGRLVGSEGNKKAENYIIGILKDLKLESLFAGEYYELYTQEVYKKYGLINDNDKPETKEIHNLVGIIKGMDSTKALVISAHFDHIGYQDGKIIRGALDNASGVATLVRITDNLKKRSQNKTFSQDVIIAFFNGEEEAQQGSKAFVKEVKDKYSSLYDINIDCVGGKNAGKISLNNSSNLSSKLTEAMKVTFKSNGWIFQKSN